jgi:glycosyltransferase involved in cell wall biosynthesis
MSGVTTHCIELASGLMAHRVEVLIFAPQPKGAVRIPSRLRGAKIVFLPSVPSHVAPTFRVCVPSLPRVLWELRSFRPDVIEASGPSPLGIDGMVSSKILEIPFVSVFHTLLTRREYLQSIFRMQSAEKLETLSWKYHKWFYNASDCVLVATAGTAQLLVRHGIRQEKIRLSPILAPLGQPRLLDPGEVRQLRQRFGLKEKVAVYLGRISPEKYLDVLLAIWGEVLKARNDCSLLIIGSGPYEARLRRRINGSALADSVVMTGEIEHEELMTSGILSACDLFVSASPTETLGLSGLEAMAHRLPVVLARSQGLSEFVQGAGFVCRLEEPEGFQRAILKLFDEDDLRRRMGEKAREIAQGFDTRHAIATVMAHYEHAIRRAAERPARNSLPYPP